MLISLASSEVFETARDAAIALLAATLRRASLPDDLEQDPLLVDLALEQATSPDLYRFAASGGKFGGDAISRCIRTCVMLRYQTAIAKALAEQYYPLNLPPLRFQKLAKNAIGALLPDEWPASFPQPAAVARMLASTQAFRHTDEEGALHETWCLNGMYHRDPSEGPAMVVSGPGFTRTGLYTHGKLHRPAACGPAFEVRRDGKVVIYEYRFDGVLHRPVCDGPAEMFDLTVMHWEIYAEHGEQHCPPGDIPSLSRYGDDPNGTSFELQYRRHGALHRDPANGPAEIRYDGDFLSLAYHVDGVHLFGASEVFPC